MYHGNNAEHNAKPPMFRVTLRLTAGVTPKTLARVLQRVCGIKEQHSLLYAELLIEGPFHFGKMTRDVAESMVAKIEYRAKTNSCPLHASIETIPLQTT